MTTYRRLRSAAAATAVVSGLFAGCTNSSQFTAGRLPYGGVQTASTDSSPQDPFASRTAPATAGAAGAAVAQSGPPTGGPNFSQAAGSFASAAAQPAPPQFGMPSSPAAAPHQAAYLQGQDQNPFSQQQHQQYQQAEESPFADQAEWATYETPAESDPFADIQGRSAFAGSAGSAPAAAPMPQISPGAANADPWQPRAQMTTAARAEEFLPPVR